MKLAKESWIIVVISLADLITTIVFIRHYGAQEANPLFRPYWQMGLGPFVLAKLACLIGPLMLLEWARRRNPRFVIFAMRTTIASYLLCYGVGFSQLNRPRPTAYELFIRQSQTVATRSVEERELR